MNLSKGFTLVEMTVVLGIIALMFAISSVSIGNTVPQATLDSAVELLISDIKAQQLHALAGYTEGRPDTSDYGILFSSNKYTLFHGPYNPSDNLNYQVALDQITITSTFPGNQIVFKKNNGDINNYTNANNTITLTQTNTNETKVITVGKYGTIESVN